MQIMNSLLFKSIAVFIVSIQIALSQVQVEAYVFESYNRGYLNMADVLIQNKSSRELVKKTQTDDAGIWKAELEENKAYIVEILKRDFEPLKYEFNTADAKDGKLYLKIEATRQPGYIFDATLAEERANSSINVLGIEGALVEIYNRTTSTEELVLKDHPHPNFQFTLKKGNHYTILIRKEGYLAKRIEAYVNVNNCIVCIDGVSDVSPGVIENISTATGLGSLLANIELQKAVIGKSFEIRNINYDYDKWYIRDDATKILDNVVNIFLDNPSIELELGSHTDARGNDDYNMELSQKRAYSARNYLILKGIDSTRISYKGYGESIIKNKCKNNVSCSDPEHEVNRRTELKITGIRNKESETWVPLSRMIQDQEFEKEMFKDVPTKKKPTPKIQNQSKKGPQLDESIYFDLLQEGLIDTVPEIVNSNFNKANENNHDIVNAKDTAAMSSHLSGTFKVVVGSFLIPSNADKLVKKFKKMGYPHTMKEIFPDSEYHSVVIESFDSESKAIEMMEMLKQKKVNCFIKYI